MLVVFLLALKALYKSQKYVLTTHLMQKSFGTNFRFKKNKPLYLCSFCRPPDNTTTPMDILNNSLSELVSNDPTTSPQIMLGSDFNLPDIRMMGR